jgi:hypothetical protein
LSAPADPTGEHHNVTSLQALEQLSELVPIGPGTRHLLVVGLSAMRSSELGLGRSSLTRKRRVQRRNDGGCGSEGKITAVRLGILHERPNNFHPCRLTWQADSENRWPAFSLYCSCEILNRAHVDPALGCFTPFGQSDPLAFHCGAF